MLGEKNLRGPTAPILDELGNIVGGTAFERSGNASPVEGRAYSLATSFEQTTKLFAPSVGNKGSPSVSHRPGIDLRANALKVRALTFT